MGDLEESGLARWCRRVLVGGAAIGQAAAYVSLARSEDEIDGPMLAFVVVAALVIFARRIRSAERGASKAIHNAFGTQILLGIATVMTGMNIVLAVLHQAVGALVVAAFTWGANVDGRVKQ